MKTAICRRPGGMEIKQELRDVLGEWKDLFERCGWRMSLGKTEVLPVGSQRQELCITLGGRDIKQEDSFTYPGGMISGDGRSDGEVCKRIQSGALVWRNVEGVMTNRNISKKLKGKVHVLFQHVFTGLRLWF